MSEVIVVTSTYAGRNVYKLLREVQSGYTIEITYYRKTFAVMSPVRRGEQE